MWTCQRFLCSHFLSWIIFSVASEVLWISLCFPFEFVCFLCPWNDPAASLSVCDSLCLCLFNLILLSPTPVSSVRLWLLTFIRLLSASQFILIQYFSCIFLVLCVLVQFYFLSFNKYYLLNFIHILIDIPLLCHQQIFVLCVELFVLKTLVLSLILSLSLHSQFFFYFLRLTIQIYPLHASFVVSVSLSVCSWVQHQVSPLSVTAFHLKCTFLELKLNSLLYG